MDEKDLNIIKALYNGNHLSKDEIHRAGVLLYGLHIDLERRLDNGRNN